MASNPRRAPRRGGPISLYLGRLLDRAFGSIAGPLLLQIAASTRSGRIQQGLRELDEEVRRLIDAGETRLKPDNPVLRNLLADLKDEMRTNSGHLAAAAEALQRNGIELAGTVQQELAFAGIPRRQLATIGIRWNSPDPAAVQRLVDYSRRESWRALVAKYGDDAVEIVQRQSLMGIAGGWSPRRTAERIRELVENVPRVQAENLMRTLQLTSYRDATALQQTANTEIIRQVVRVAALDQRTCLACIAAHGDVLWDSERDGGNPVERVHDHHSGRCSSVIIVRGRQRDIQSGETWFNSLPPQEQAGLAALQNSPGKLEALRSGRVRLDDFRRPYRDDTFGQMLGEASLQDALEKAG